LSLLGCSSPVKLKVLRALTLLHDLDVDEAILVSGQQEVAGLLQPELAGPDGVVHGLDERRDHLLVVHRVRAGR